MGYAFMESWDRKTKRSTGAVEGRHCRPFKFFQYTELDNDDFFQYLGGLSKAVKLSAERRPMP